MSTNYYLNKNEDVDTKDGLKYILRHFRNHIPLFSVVTSFLLLVNILGQVYLPKLLRKAIDIDIPSGDMSKLTDTVILALAILVVYTVLNYIRVRLTGVMSQRILYKMREEIFRKIQYLPTQFISDNQTGDIIQRLTGNVEGINQFFTEGLMRILNISFAVITILLTMFFLDWKLALISFSGSALVIIFLIIQGKYLEKEINKQLEKEGDVSSKTQETLDGFLSIQSMHQQRSWIKQFSKLTDQQYEISKKVVAISACADAFMIFISILTIASSLLLSLNFFSKDILTLGTVIIFNTYSFNLFRSLNNISRIWQNIKTGLSSACRLNEILKLDNNIKTPPNAYTPKDVRGDIEFKDVDFGYNGDDVVLSDVNFNALQGKTIAIVGPTGGGKTTFVNLIARLYDVKNGYVLVDGHDVKEWDLDVLRNSIGYLIQDTFLFEDTVLNNLRYNNEKVSKKKALDMFAFLGVRDLIDRLPKGLDTKISSDSSSLSSGQKQIIALVRILLREPKILILDEATARIDTRSEKMLQRAIEKATVGKTTFIIAHRLSTIFNADNIVLISNSRILEQGTHDELIKQRGTYYEMYSKFVGR